MLVIQGAMCKDQREAYSKEGRPPAESQQRNRDFSPTHV